MILLEGFLALVAALLLFGAVWCRFATTPQERAAIRRFDFFPCVLRTAEPVRCPGCGSGRLLCRDGGFRASKALAGVLLTGSPLGANAGLLGRCRTPCTCLTCGRRFTVCAGPEVKPRQTL